uniref:Uncharacterized protein n=1 Tax=Poecilia latipinna TaxID=48699 RepID=A0A3B3VTY1_9TELE
MFTNILSAIPKMRCSQNPTNILELLRWFANTVIDIDYDNTIQLTFDPNSRHYGCHYYRNREGLLESLPRGYRYYTIGNIHQAGSEPLPPYVVNSRRGNIAWNSARILIRVNEGRRIDQVFITRHYDASEYHGSSYDPEQTFRITTYFLRQLRKPYHIILKNMQLWCLLIVIMMLFFYRIFVTYFDQIFYKNMI